MQNDAGAVDDPSIAGSAPCGEFRVKPPDDCLPREEIGLPTLGDLVGENRQAKLVERRAERHRNFAATAMLLARQRNPKVDALILSLPGEHVTFISHGKRAPRELLQNLAAGKAIVMIADQHGGPRGIVAPFFGRETSTLSLPAALVARQDLPLFAMAGHRIDEGRHELAFRRLVVPPDDGRGEDARRRQITTLCNRAIADAVLEHPDQYFWYHRRFRPPGDLREPAHTAPGHSID